MADGLPTAAAQQDMQLMLLLNHRYQLFVLHFRRTDGSGNERHITFIT